MRNHDHGNKDLLPIGYISTLLVIFLVYLTEWT